MNKSRVKVKMYNERLGLDWRLLMNKISAFSHLI